MYHAPSRNTSRTAGFVLSNISSKMPNLAQASPVFSVLLRVLCVKAFAFFKKGKALTQRTQRNTEREGEKLGMDSLELKILGAFDAPGAPVRSLSDLGDPALVKNAVSQLVERGLLRAMTEPASYARTEDGRLQLAAPRDVTLYTRPGCHLCEEAKQQIAPLLKEFSARLTEINIDEDPDLRARYDYDVPVIFLGARKAAKHRVDLTQFRRQLCDAGAR
jgi:glutaredoxin